MSRCIADRRTSRALAACSLLACAGAAMAGHSQATISSPGVFVQAGATNWTSAGGAFGTPGADMQNFITLNGVWDFHEDAFAGDGVVSESAANTTATTDNGAAGTVQPGLIRMTAYNTASNDSPFPVGCANGGWNETFLILHPSLNGQPGFFVFSLRVDGVLHAAGMGGAAQVWTTGYKNSIELTTNTYFNRGASDPIATDRQRCKWVVVTFADEEVVNRTVHDTVTMSVPFTFGQPFTVGVYAAATAGLRAHGPDPDYSTGDLDFSHTIRWGGVVDVYHNGAPVPPGVVIDGATTIDWIHPILACPGDTNGDGIVDFEDLNNVLSDYLMTGPGLAGDANGDGTVDFEDLNLVLSYYLTDC